MRRANTITASSAALAAATALAFAVFVLATFFTALAQAADMPARKSIGQVFAEPVSDPRLKIAVEDEDRALVIPLVRAPGYYGRAGDFAYRNYYGASVWDIWTRYPYACAAYPVC